MEMTTEYKTVVRMLFGEIAKWHVSTAYHDGCPNVAA